jgi:predicted nucleic acid-binding protein
MRLCFATCSSRSDSGQTWTTDAYLAALAIEHGAELCSTDRDFSRFAGLRWANPLEA